MFLLLTNKTYMIVGIVLLNMMVAASCGIGSKKLQVLIFFSGLIHISWVISAPMLMACKYFFLYTIVTGPIFFDKPRPLLIINLAGLPPLTGFFMKIGVLQLIRLNMGVILLSFSVVLLFSYMRLFLMGREKNRLKYLIPCCLGGLF